jgi:drug/metabolite transporter (DMT)-like permease
MMAVLAGVVRFHFHFGTHIRLDRLDIPAVAVAQCLGAAMCFAVSSVLQQRSASQQPPDLSLRPGLLMALLRSPMWLLGIVADIGGFVLQFLALRIAALALVTPLLVVGLIFSVTGAAWADHRRVTGTTWRASGLVVFGLIVFLVAAQPGPGHPRASGLTWVLLSAAVIVLVGLGVRLARGTARRRALFLGAATGITYGYTLAITEHTGHLLDHGLVHALTTWSPYVLAVSSVIGLLLNQSAFQAGDLQWSLPVITVAEPVVAIAIGQAIFGEYIASTPLAVTGEVAGMAAVVIGVVGLVRDVRPPSAGAVGDNPRNSQISA